MKIEEKKQARKLRKNQGLSLKEISEKLNVAKSTVSLWVRDIELTDSQLKNLKNKERNPEFVKKKIKSYKKIRQQYQDKGREDAKKNNQLHSIGCSLYWAEGAKNKNSIKFSNSDHRMLTLFKRFLIEFFDISIDDILIEIHCYDDLHNVKEIENYWTSVLNLPKSSLRKTMINKVSPYSGKKRCGKLEWGTCKIMVHSTEVVQRIYGAIQEYGNFTDEKWIDGQ